MKNGDLGIPADEAAAEVLAEAFAQPARSAVWYRQLADAGFLPDAHLVPRLITRAVIASPEQPGTSPGPKTSQYARRALVSISPEGAGSERNSAWELSTRRT